MSTKFFSQNLPHQWAMIALLAAGGFGVSLALPSIIGAPLAIFCVVAYMQFMYAAATRCYPLQEPVLVRAYGRIPQWWERFAQPLQVVLHDGRTLYVRDQYDYREFYDSKGYQVGFEQTIDWDASDMGWKPGDPAVTSIRFTQTVGTQRMSWLSRLRSPRLSEKSANKKHPISGLLNSRPSGHVTRLTMRAA